jgi:hypothetical protein
VLERVVVLVVVRVVVLVVVFVVARRRRPVEAKPVLRAAQGPSSLEGAKLTALIQRQNRRLREPGE